MKQPLPSYAFDAPALALGLPLDGTGVLAAPEIRIPLAMMNRHGLIAGSTGTGKTRTLQLLTEGLARAGVPTFLADVKGDLAGLALPGDSPKAAERAKDMGLAHTPEAFPTEFFSLTGVHGTQVRATISSFGPLLLGKVLDLSDVQQSVLTMVFRYCDDRDLPLLDFADLRSTLMYLSDAPEELRAYGVMSRETVGVLVRKLVELEDQGAGAFFGEPELDIDDLLRTAPDGRGIVNILSLADVQDKPRLTSTFLFWLLGRFYYGLPEAGDLAKPKIVFFFDEAHLLFDDASPAFLEHVTQVARLIRSKGVGVFFVTQTPKDIHEDVLAQLGNRVQHAVRAFTPKDAKNLKAAASTFPPSTRYPIAETLTALGTGEALVSVLDPKGVPTEPAATRVFPPSSSMTTIAEEDYARILAASPIAAGYARPVDRESAHELLAKKIAAAADPLDAIGAPPAPRGTTRRRTAATPRKRMSSTERVLGNVARQATRTVMQQVIRGIFGLLRK